MKLELKFWYVIKRDAFANIQAESVLDMLRYDGARVECNAPPGYWLLTKHAKDAAPPNEARWKSFMLKVYVVSRGYYAPSRSEVDAFVKAEDAKTAAAEKHLEKKK